MDKNRNGYTLSIIALVVAVIGIAVGYSAFSTALRIESTATVTPSEETFKVVFSDSKNEITTNDITPVKSAETINATKAKINNASDPTISNLSAVFTEPGQEVSYTFYVHNVGQYNAFLKSIIYGNSSEGTSPKVCKAITSEGGATNELVQSACEGVTLETKVGQDITTTGSLTNITGKQLSKNNTDGNNEVVTITIRYASDAERADGDFTISFGDITLDYNSFD